MPSMTPLQQGRGCPRRSIGYVGAVGLTSTGQSETLITSRRGERGGGARWSSSGSPQAQPQIDPGQLVALAEVANVPCHPVVCSPLITGFEGFEQPPVRRC